MLSLSQLCPHIHAPLPSHTPQAVERRFSNWMSNLEYALEYNSAEKSHWVRGASIVGGVSRCALPRVHAPPLLACSACPAFPSLHLVNQPPVAPRTPHDTTITTNDQIGLNALADLSHDEYLAKFGLGAPRFNRLAAAAAAKNALGAPKSARVPGFKHGELDAATLPPAVDWRAKKAVAEVKNQMSCGSCWAFSATGAIEGINAITTGELLSLSEQMLVDCDTEQDQGCQGGLMDYAFEFVARHGGIELEEDYPYTAEDGECAEKSNRRVVTIDGYQDVPQLDEVRGCFWFCGRR